MRGKIIGNPGGMLHISPIDFDPHELLDQYGEQEIEISISIPKKKRSLSANAYAWVLIGKLAQAIPNATKTDIYRAAIRDIGDNYTFVIVRSDAAEEFKRNWEHSDNSGWFAEKFDCFTNEDGEEFETICCYYGSSVYDSKQMSKLIECLVDEAKLYGIETMTPAEQAELLRKWEERYGRN